MKDKSLATCFYYGFLKMIDEPSSQGKSSSAPVDLDHKTTRFTIGDACECTSTEENEPRMKGEPLIKAPCNEKVLN